MAYDMEVGGIWYNKVTATELTVTSGDRAYVGFVTIPESVTAEGRTWQVTAIGDAAFYGCQEVYSVSIPRTVTTIGNEAFVRCSFLSKFIVDEANPWFCAVDGVLMDKQGKRLLSFPAGHYTKYAVPQGVEEIGRWAFTYCTRLTEVTLPRSVTTIGDAAFYGCTALTAITLPEQLSSIGVWAFAECSQLREMTIPASVSSVGDGAFSFCPSLQSIYVGGNSFFYSSVDGVLMNRQQTTVVAFPGGRGGSYRLPATVDSIGTQAFYGCSKIESVTLPASLASVAENQFVFCDNLKEIQVDRNNTRLTSQDGVLLSKDHSQIVFYPNAKAGDYAVPEGVTALDHGPFLGSTALTGIDIPLSVRSIGNWTFLGCEGLSTVNIPYLLTSLGTQAFSDCTSLRTIICNGNPVATSGFEEATLSSAKLYVPQGSKGAYLGTEGWEHFANVEEYGLYAQEQQVARAQELRIPVMVTRTLPITAAEATLTLPQDFTLSSREQEGKATPLVELSEANKATHTLSCTDMKNNTYLLSIRPKSGRPLADADTLVYFTVKADADCETGVYEMKLNNISFTYHTLNNEGEALQNDHLAGLSVRLLVGDVNRNGRVNVADLVETIRYINGDQTGTFHQEEADVNANGTVNYYDAEETVRMIQQQSDRSPMVVTDFWQTAVTTADRLTCKSLSAEAGTDFTLDVSLNTARTDLTAFQFQVLLPRGLRLLAENDGEICCQLPARYGGDGRSVSARLLPDSSERMEGKAYTVVGMSTSLSPLVSGLMVSLPVHTSLSTTVGTHEIVLKETLFADADANEYYLADATTTITVTESAGVSDLTEDGAGIRAGRPVYDLGGRKVGTTGGSRQLNKGVYIIEGRKVVIR